MYRSILYLYSKKRYILVLNIIHIMARRRKARKMKKKIKRESAQVAFDRIVRSALKFLQLKFSTRYNAKWGQNDFLNMLARMCRAGKKGTATNRYDDSEVDDMFPLPSAHWFFDRFGSIPPEIMLEGCTAAVDYTVRQARLKGLLRGILQISIDLHNIPVYGKVHKSGKGLDSTYCVNTKRTQGTNKCYQLATVHCVTPRCRTVLGVILVQEGDTMAEIVGRLLDMVEKRKIRVNRVTMDRGFNSKEVIRELERRGMTYIMPYIKYDTIKKIIMEVKDGKRDAVSSHTISKNTDPETVTVVVLKHDKKTTEESMTEEEQQLEDTFKDAVKNDRAKKKDRKEHDPIDDYYVFITNMPLSDIQNNPKIVTKLYKERWGIETSYRCYETIRPRTATTKHTPRIALMFFPWVFYNAWMVANHLVWRSGYGTRGKPAITQDIFMKMVLVILNRIAAIERGQLNSCCCMCHRVDPG